MHLQITASEDTHIVRLAGDLDLYGVAAARESLLYHLARNRGVELDLGAVTGCDAAGLQVLISARRTAEASGGTFRIHTAAPEIGKCAALLGVDPEAFRSHTQ